MRRVVRATLLGASTALGATVVYESVLKPWHERWGATDDEVDLVLPGDELVAPPATQVTRAIDVGAPPEAVWPWIVQLGADRGGFYSYDWLENLFGLRVHSAEEIHDEWQDLGVGDLVAATRSGAGGWYVSILDEPRVMVLQVANVAAGRPVRRDDAAGWEFSWTFALVPVDEGRTRLLVRERVAIANAFMRVAMVPVGVVSFVMTRKMLLGIRDRAERHGCRAH